MGLNYLRGATQYPFPNLLNFDHFRPFFKLTCDLISYSSRWFALSVVVLGDHRYIVLVILLDIISCIRCQTFTLKTTITTITHCIHCTSSYTLKWEISASSNFLVKSCTPKIEKRKIFSKFVPYIKQ